MNRERLESLAHQGACRWNTHRLYPDLLQEARIVAWQHWDQPDPHIVRIIRLRVIDAARRELGRPGQTRQAELLTIDTDNTPPQTTVDHPCPATEWGLTGRNHLIARMLAHGIDKQAIAHHLNIHPSRVTQLLAHLRTHHQDTCR